MDLGGGSYLRFNEKVVTKRDYLQNIYSLLSLVGRFGVEFQVQSLADGKTLAFSGDLPTDDELYQAFTDVLQNGDLGSIITTVTIPNDAIVQIGNRSSLPRIFEIEPEEANYVFDVAKKRLNTVYGVDSSKYTIDPNSPEHTLTLKFIYDSSSHVEILQTSAFQIKDENGEFVGYIRINQYENGRHSFYSVSHQAIDSRVELRRPGSYIVPYSVEDILNTPSYTLWNVDRIITNKDRTPKTTQNVP